MDTSRKRPSTGGSERSQGHQSKRQKTADAASRSLTPNAASPGRLGCKVDSGPTVHDLGRDGLKRSIGLQLQQAGFHSSKGDALEAFTTAAESYLVHLLGHIKRSANGARRNDPIPQDFEYALAKANISLSSLEPQVKHSVPKDVLEPSFFNPIKEDVQQFLKPRPFLGDELSGQKEKDERPWIPKHFPTLPSPYAYKFTPYHHAVDCSKEQAQAEVDARKGERALRNINRAARIRRQKEIKAIAQSNPMSRERHTTWEKMMTVLLPDVDHAGRALEIADHSTIVNYGAQHGRKSVHKPGRRAQADGPSVLT
ncbi:hypothetical protein F5B19DRAFT_281411 [Rostrohypoxylon terebratum]|nr:hypothetical protein F5B19DRAFT_281411 [Rostrohypoxylon terebratum]